MRRGPGGVLCQDRRWGQRGRRFLWPYFYCRALGGFYAWLRREEDKKMTMLSKLNILVVLEGFVVVLYKVI